MKDINSGILKGDIVIWTCYILLLLTSLMFVHSNTGVLEYHRNSSFAHFLITQFLFCIVAFGVTLVTSNISYKRLFNIANWALYLGVFLLAFTYLWGDATNDAKRWLKIPIINQTLQTSDVAKLCLTIFVAKVMATHQKDDADILKGAKISAIAIAVTCGLIMPANLSTALLVGFTMVLLLIIARVKIKHILIVGSGLALVGFLAIVALGKTGAMHRAETWVSRIEAFTQTDETEHKRDNFQAEQARIAIANGGFFGQGTGASMQKNVIPHPYSDFIFSSIIEERGLFAALIIIVLYCALMHRSVMAAKHQTRAFPAFLCIGLALNIMLQAISNMIVAVNLVPVTGQPLPLISMGGTALIMTSISVGIIINITKYSEKAGKETEKEEIEEHDREQNIEDLTDYPFVIN